MKLKEKVKEEVKNNTKCKAMLCYHLGKNNSTIWRALNQNKENALLTTKKAVIIIASELKLSEREVLTDFVYNQ